MEKTTTNFTAEQIDLLEKAEANLEALTKELENKKYLIDLMPTDMEILRQFIVKDASWKFTEGLGIIEVEKDLKTAGAEDGKYYLKAIPIEAIYYYMSKVEGSGNKVKGDSFKSLPVYLRILKGITSAIEAIKADTERKNKAEFEVAARREGIDPDSPSSGK